MTDEFASLRNAINQREVVPAPTGDDAKKGEDKPLPNGAKSKGKEVVVYSSKPAPSAAQAAKPATKQLTSASAAFHKATSRESIPTGTTLEAIKSFELMEQGLVEIQQAQPLQAVPTTKPAQAKPSKPPSKPITKRPAPTAEETGPAAKRQKVKKDLAAKASRAEQEKKKKEDQKKRAEKAQAARDAKIELLRDQTNTLIEDNILVQHSLIRSGYIHLTPEESEMCELEARVQACRKSLIFIEKLEGYSKDDFEFMRSLINDRKPLFNSELSEKFNRVLQTLVDRPFEETEERRAQHSYALERDGWSAE